jgi:hypothetical protein
MKICMWMCGQVIEKLISEGTDIRAHKRFRQTLAHKSTSTTASIQGNQGIY